MDKILLGLGALAVGIGALFLPRIAAGKGRDDGPIDEITVTPTQRVGRVGIVTRGSSPRGIENNNPFNLEYRSSIDWIGQLGTDGRFVIFDDAVNGIRAGMINIRTKFRRDGANTVRALINILSPAHENPTEAYIGFVARSLQKSPDEPLVYESVIIPLSKAIVQFENGENPYTNETFREAYERT